MKRENKTPKLVIVVPCYNEEEALAMTNERLTQLLGKMMEQGEVDGESRVFYVDDGSSDATWTKIEQLAGDRLVNGLKLTRNFGHQAAILAGIEQARKEGADATVTIDADLQDDVAAIPEMVARYREGAEVVYGVRQGRRTDTWFKRTSAQGFYRLMAFLGVNLVYNSADFRLLGRVAMENLARFEEQNMFVRGVVPLLGGKTSKVYYERQKRVAGESKYPVRKMARFAVDGMMSFSITPIKLIGTIGTGVMLVAGGLIIYSVIQHTRGEVTPGWSSLMVSIWFMGGVQMLCLRVIGEYLGKVFEEVKKRPRYLVEEVV